MMLASTLCLVTASAQTASLPKHLEKVSSTSRIFGDGAKTIQIILRYDEPVTRASLKQNTFQIEGKTITNQFVRISDSSTKPARSRHYVILELATSTSLTEKPRPQFTPE